METGGVKGQFEEEEKTTAEKADLEMQSNILPAEGTADSSRESSSVAVVTPTTFAFNIHSFTCPVSSVVGSVTSIKHHLMIHFADGLLLCLTSR